MWDGTIQFLIKSSSEPTEVIESTNLGKPIVSDALILVTDFKQSNNLKRTSLEIKKGNVIFCSSSGCKNITNK